MKMLLSSRGRFRTLALLTMLWRIMDPLHGLLYGASQIPASHVEREGGVAAISFPVDVVGAVFDLRAANGRGD